MALTVFISYAREDSASAEQLATSLERQGFVVLLDQHFIRAGQFTEQLDRAIAGCDVFLLLISQASVHSPWVNRELHLAVDDHDRPVLPVELEDADLTPFRLVLAGLQRVNARDGGPQAVYDVIDGIHRTAAARRRRGRREHPARGLARGLGTLIASVGVILCVLGMGYFFLLFAQAWNSSPGSGPPPEIPVAFGIFFVGLVVSGVGEALRRAGGAHPSRFS